MYVKDTLGNRTVLRLQQIPHEPRQTGVLLVPIDSRVARQLLGFTGPRLSYPIFRDLLSDIGIEF